MRLKPSITKHASFLLVPVICLFLQSCALFGIHLKLHNPKKPGKLPDFSKETILLGELNPRRTCFDVSYYDLALDVDASHRSLSGDMQMHAHANADFDSMQIDLHPNFTITRLYDAATQKDLPFTRTERAVMVRHPKKKGDHFVLRIKYEGKPMEAKKAPWKGGFVWKKDQSGNPWIGVACEGEGASIWWPLKDHTSSEPDSMRLHYTVPAGLVAIGNGQFEGKTEQQGKTTYNWFVSYPINAYDVTFYAGNFKKLSDTYVGINNRVLTLEYYVLEANVDKAKMSLERVPGILKCFEKNFGLYPWYRDGYRLVESPFTGMEHQTAIAIGKELTSTKRYSPLTDVLLHETAHEWWGNSVTAKDFADVWLQEGFATYAEAIYLEQKDGRSAYDDLLNFHRLFVKNKYPVVGVRDRRWFHYRKSADVYSKGAWILHTLRQQINHDSLFFDIIKTFQEKHRYQVVESQDFVNWVNQKTGKDYNWFFNQYLYHREAPELEYSIDKTGTLYFKWVNVDSSFNQLKLYMHSEGYDMEIVPTTTIQKVTLQGLGRGSSFTMRESMLVAIRENGKLATE